MEEVVVVIQSQRNSYHAHQGEQRKVEILQQAAELGKVKVFISCSSMKYLCFTLLWKWVQLLFFSLLGSLSSDNLILSKKKCTFTLMSRLIPAGSDLMHVQDNTSHTTSVSHLCWNIRAWVRQGCYFPSLGGCTIKRYFFDSLSRLFFASD